MADRPDTHTKALQINLHQQRYGTFTEVGGGQEVVRWFFQAGGASGTIAKSLSAYDMHVSDAIYGHTDRYVSRSRLEAMLTHEFDQNLERLADVRGDTSAFFVFADTVSARNFQGTNECHGWLGVRFQACPREAPSQIVIHVRLLDPSNVLQQEVLGVVGVNLLYGAFFLHSDPGQALVSLKDGLGPDRVEVDMIEFSGTGYRDVDNRLMSLKLVQSGLSKAAMLGPDGQILQPSEVFHKRPVLIERGSFYPVTRTHLDILRAAREKFVERLDGAERDRVVTVAEITMRNLATSGSSPGPGDFLERADMLAAAGLTVLVSDYFEFHHLARYLREFTHEPIGVALGAPTLLELFDPKYSDDLQGGVMGALGRLFRLDLKLFVYPWQQDHTLWTATTLPVPPEFALLYQYICARGLVVELPNDRPEYLSIRSDDVRKILSEGGDGWDVLVPPPVAELIQRRELFGYKRRAGDRT